MLSSYLDLKFEVKKRPKKSRYAIVIVIRLVNLGPFAIFSSYKLTTSSGKHFEAIGHAHIVYVLYILITSAKDADDLSFCFDRDREKKRQEVTKKTYKIISTLKLCSMMCSVLHNIRNWLLTDSVVN